MLTAECVDGQKVQFR